MKSSTGRVTRVGGSGKRFTISRSTASMVTLPAAGMCAPDIESSSTGTYTRSTLSALRRLALFSRSWTQCPGAPFSQIFLRCLSNFAVLATGLEPLLRQSIEAALISGAGLRMIGLEHTDDRGSSVEEAEVIAAEVERLLATDSYVDRRGEQHEVTLGDILVVAPYNA